MLSNKPEFKALIEMAERSQNGLIIFDQNQRKPIYISKTASSILAIHNAPSKDGLSFLMEQIMPGDYDMVLRSMEDASDGPDPIEVEFGLKDGVGPRAIVIATVSSIMEGSYLLISLVDVTKMKKSDEHMIEFGAKKNMLLESLIHNLSGSLEMMQNLATEASKPTELDSRDRTEKYLRMLNDNSKFCIDLINDLLVNEHENSATVVAKEARFDVMDKINYVVEELRHSFTTKKFVVEKHCASSIVTSDDVKILQVLVNLISNSIKFTKDDAEIRIVIRDHDDKFLTIGVIDNGIGIPEYLQSQVFERKGPAGRTGLNGERTLGLGLSINKQLVNIMGGEHWLHSKEGQGAEFYFTVPR